MKNQKMFRSRVFLGRTERRCERGMGDGDLELYAGVGGMLSAHECRILVRQKCERASDGFEDEI